MDPNSPIIRGLFIDDKGFVWEEREGRDPTCVNSSDQKITPAVREALNRGVDQSSATRLAEAALYGKTEKLPPDNREASAVRNVFNKTLKSSRNREEATCKLESEYRAMVRSKALQEALYPAKNAGIDYFLSHPKAMGTPGIFRVPGGDADIARLRIALLETPHEIASWSEPSKEDLYNLADAFKRLSRESPIFSKEQTEILVSLDSLIASNPKAVTSALKAMISQLTPEERIFLNKCLDLREGLEREGAKTNEERGEEVCLNGKGATSMLAQNIVTGSALIVEGNPKGSLTNMNGVNSVFEFLYQRRGEILTLS